MTSVTVICRKARLSNPKACMREVSWRSKSVLDQIGRTTGIETAWVRLFYQYGAYEDKRRVVPAVITSLLSHQKQKLTLGEQIRDYLHVEDVASAIAAIFRTAPHR